MLTAAQVDHYRTFGFLTLRNWLSADEVTAVAGELEACVAEAYRDRPFDGSNRHWVPLLTPKAPTISAFAEERFAEAAEQLLGDDVVLLMADGNRYVGDTLWHADAGTELQGVKFVAYLDTVAADTGALRVIPGSHLEPHHSSAHTYLSSYVDCYSNPAAERAGLQATHEVAAVALPSEPGDVVVFNPPTFHASVGGGVDRRMCTWNYFRLPRDESTRARLCGFTAGLAQQTGKMWPEKSYSFYDQTWIANADGSATRTRMIERMHEAGILAAAGVEA